MRGDGCATHWQQEVPTWLPKVDSRRVRRDYPPQDAKVPDLVHTDRGIGQVWPGCAPDPAKAVAAFTKATRQGHC
jgi:hypothetical protein